MKVHVLKTDPEPFDANARRVRFFEIRRNDRNFAVQDLLFLRETTHTGLQISEGAPLQYTGRNLLTFVTHVQQGYGIDPDWAALSFQLLPLEFVLGSPEVSYIEANSPRELVVDIPYLAHELRVFAEHYELDERATKLRAMLNGPSKSVLSEGQMADLWQQLQIMQELLHILNARMIKIRERVLSSR